MKNIYKLALPLILASSLLNASDIGIDSVGINVGMASINAMQNDKQGSVTLANEPDETYTHIEIYTLLDGVFEDKTLKPSINGVYNINDEFKNITLTIGLNKYFEYDDFNLYVGALAGMGELHWSYNPLNATSVEDTSSDSLVGTLQAGAEYKISKTILATLNAQYNIHSYKTTLRPTSSTKTEIEHTNSHSLSLGLRFLF